MYLFEQKSIILCYTQKDFKKINYQKVLHPQYFFIVGYLRFKNKV